MFRTQNLIRAAGGWHTTNACAWSNGIVEPGKVQLNTYWPSMRALFVDLLGVSAQETEIVVQPLPDRHAGAQGRRPATSIILPESNNVDLIDDLGIPHETEYAELLDKVINSARAAHLQPKANVDMLTTEAAVSGNGSEDYFKMRSAKGVERDKMIGAAGELYVSTPPTTPFMSLILILSLRYSSCSKMQTPDYPASQRQTGRAPSENT